MSIDPQAGQETAGVRRFEARGVPGEFSARTFCGITGEGSNRVAVRARRTVLGRVRHGAPAGQAPRPGEAAAGCLLVRESLTLWLQAPFASIPKAQKVLPSLLDVQLPFPLEGCQVRFVDIRRTPEGGVRALAVAARADDVRARLDRCRAQGWDPVLLDHEGLALWTQSREECPLPAETRRILLHLDADHVVLVVGQGDRYDAAHSVQSEWAGEDPGGQAFPEQIIGRLQRILRAELPEPGAVHWLASGAGASHAARVQGLHRALAGARPGPLTIHRAPEAFLARALATRALTPGPLRCNLRAGELAHPDLLRQLRARKLTTAALFLAAGLLLCGVNLGWHLLTAQREAGFRQTIAGLAADLAPGVRIFPGQEVREARKASERRAVQEAPFLDAFAVPLGGALAELAQAGRAEGTAYATLALRRAGFELAGEADDWDQCERLAARLRALGYAVTLERQEALAEAQVRFLIQGQKATAGARDENQ